MEDDDYDEDATTPQYSSLSAAELDSAVNSRTQDVRAYLARGSYAEAVRRSLDSPPLGKDIQNIKTVMEALAAVKASDIPIVIKSLSQSDIDAVEAGGIGSIMRTLTDRTF
ncbi:hypothetical protein BC829DRAFT_440691 [Chytridium lagenaria]|nr:hypothetical protein BC829DRAFT_440691 [Chytridium lagenaria]